MEGKDTVGLVNRRKGEKRNGRIDADLTIYRHPLGNERPLRPLLQTFAPARATAAQWSMSPVPCRHLVTESTSLCLPPATCHLYASLPLQISTHDS